MNNTFKQVNEPQGMTLSLRKGPFQNNGASPWYSTIGVGSPPQELKFSFDTGSNFVWVTSSLCASDSCKHYGGDEFRYQTSKTFTWVDQTTQTVGFGPWGDMSVEAGNDRFLLPSISKDNLVAVNAFSDVYLAQSYQGQQFEELDWDGGIGLPSLTVIPDTQSVFKSYRGAVHSQSEDSPSFHFFQSLIDQGVVSSDSPFITFLTDGEKTLGKMEMGRLNQEYKDSVEYLYLPWEPYSISSVSYIWTSQLTSFSVGDEVLISEQDSVDSAYFFSLDSGSSQFKGDPKVMNEAFKRTTQSGNDVIIELGKTDQNESGRLVISSSIYDVFIDEGEDQGETVCQFAPLDGLDNLVLVGSVLMDYVYTVYEYKVITSGAENRITPLGMWIFNKPNGPKIITSKQSKSARIFYSF